MRLCLYEPDIPQNCGAILRLGACMGAPVDIIEPCGFPLDDRRMRRAGMDYMERVELTRHNSWQRYLECRQGENRHGDNRQGRLLLLTTRAETAYCEFAYRVGDSIMVGRESAGVPDAVHRAADARLIIPMRAGLRSINVAMAAAMVLGEALRQTLTFPR